MDYLNVNRWPSVRPIIFLKFILFMVSTFTLGWTKSNLFDFGFWILDLFQIYMHTAYPINQELYVHLI